METCPVLIAPPTPLRPGRSGRPPAPYYEYIRCLARWPLAHRNVARLVGRHSETLRLTALVVLQTYNVLDIVQALQFFDP